VILSVLSSCVSEITLQVPYPLTTMNLTILASPEEQHKKFYSLRTVQDVADFLEIDLNHLYYHLHIVPDRSRYTTFQIPKRRGGARTINAPATALKIIQQKLNQILLNVYQPKPPVHSFVHGRSIVTNANLHSGHRNVLNVDLKDFFPSINFGRVRGMFMGTPYKLEATAATVLAQICCFNNELPQGAPTSPIVSNMICAKMDSQLTHLAKKYKCVYTRYSDDLTFSTNLKEFPTTLAKINELGQAEVGEELNRTIEDNGFKVNIEKVRLRDKKRRQQVTGLTTNKFPNVRRRYVRNVRAMLHAWEKYGLKAAEKEFLTIHDKKHRSPFKQEPSFARVVKGKIDYLGMVRGKNNPIYRNFLSKLRDLAPELVPESRVGLESSKTPTAKSYVKKVHVTTEGKSDWKHLKAAFNELRKSHKFTELMVEFNEYEEDMGDDQLLATCRANSKTPQLKPTVFIFDRDNPKILRKVTDESKEYKTWSNSVFSLAIPIPQHRQDCTGISIELYYKDSEIKRQSGDGRRLFLSNEFNPKSGRHKDGDLNCALFNKLHGELTIIDDKVFDENDENVALPKDDFAKYVLSCVAPFDDFDFSEFERIFECLSEIAKVAQTTTPQD